VQPAIRAASALATPFNSTKRTAEIVGSLLLSNLAIKLNSLEVIGLLLWLLGRTGGLQHASLRAKWNRLLAGVVLLVKLLLCAVRLVGDGGQHWMPPVPC
jgi:hypothetical protein